MSTTIRVYVSEALLDVELEGTNPQLLSDVLGIYFELPSSAAEVPEELAPYVKEVTIFSYMPHEPFREAGIYSLDEARGVVEHNLSHGAIGHNIKITSRNFEDAIGLLAEIWAGDTPPETSHDDDRISRDRKALAVFKDQVLRQIDGPTGYPILLRVLKGKLGGAWPFCRKSTVLRRVDAILAGDPFT